MNYIDQITKYFTDKGQEEQIPFVLLSAKVQAMEQGTYVASFNDELTTMEDLDIDDLLVWANTKEGFDYWWKIYNHSHKRSR